MGGKPPADLASLRGVRNEAQKVAEVRLVLVKDVPNRTYILFHSANFPDELQGCIAPGVSLMSDRIAVSRSRDAMKEFEELTHEKECSLVIKFAPSAALKSQ